MLAVIALLLFTVLAVTLGPLITIWSLNTLFSLGIPYSPSTWFAALWVSAFVYGSKIKGKDSK